MFLPQAITAVGSSLLQGNPAGGSAGSRVSWPLGANLVAMILLIASRFAEGSQSVAYGLLPAATAFLGAGFGLTVPSVNTFAAAFHPDAVDRSVLVLNSLLGLGTALAPVFVAVFVGLGAWVGLPVLAALAVAGLMVVSARLLAESGRGGRGRGSRNRSRRRGGRDGARRARVPAGFWVFAGFAVLYGFCETMNGNWSQLDLTSLQVSATLASLALTAFWAMVTAGRLWGASASSSRRACPSSCRVAGSGAG